MAKSDWATCLDVWPNDRECIVWLWYFVVLGGCGSMEESVEDAVSAELELEVGIGTSTSVPVSM